MYSDFINFFHTLPLQGMDSGSILPESFREHIPVDSFMSFFTDLNSSVKVLGGAVTLVLALLVCFFGYKFAKIFMSITGFLAGAVIGLTVSIQIYKHTILQVSTGDMSTVIYTANQLTEISSHN